MADKRTGGRLGADALPHALTFFLTAGERRSVLSALRAHGRDRRVALLRALQIGAGATREKKKKGGGDGGRFGS